MTERTAVDLSELLAQSSWARRLARTLVGEADADDLVQDTLTAAVGARPDGDRPLRPWLAQVLRRLGSNRRRERARRQAREAMGVAQREVPNPEDLVVHLETQRMLAELVMGLPIPLRDVVVLRYYVGLDATQIAARTGAPAGTVRRRLKEALDRLRAELDRRHGGRRAPWRRALVMLAPRADSQQTRPGGVRPLRVVGGIAALAIGAGALWWYAGERTAIRRTDGAHRWSYTKAGKGPLRDSSTAPPRMAIVPATTDASACSRSVEEAERAVAALIPEFGRVPSGYLFHLGDAHPAAAADLQPRFERALRSSGEADAGVTVECRTWACRAHVVTASHWRGGSEFLEHPELVEHIELGSIGDHRLVRDVVTGRELHRWTVRARLKSAFRGDAAAVLAAKVPVDGRSCDARLATLQSRLAFMRKRVEEFEEPLRGFHAGAFNAALTVKFQDLVTRLLAGTNRIPTVECRDRYCRVTAVGARGWDNLLSADLTFRRMTPRGRSDGSARVYLVDPDRPWGGDVVYARLREFRRQPHLAACAGRYPQNGFLQVRFNVPDETFPNEDGSTGRLELWSQGPLAGTPLGRCVEEALSATVVAQELPARIRGGGVWERFEFPLKPGL